MFKLNQLGSDELPEGWYRPTAELVWQQRLYVQEGLALPSAPHLYRPAARVDEFMSAGNRINDEILAALESGKAALRRFVDPLSGSPIVAVGMASSQLAQPNSMAAFAYSKGIPDLGAESRTTSVELLVNPAIVPVVDSGVCERIEFCFSAPGTASVVQRWNEVDVFLPNSPAYPNGKGWRLSGIDAWIVQHEHDHTVGELCVLRAYREGRPVYFVPPGLKAAFVKLGGDHRSYPFLFSPGQWSAMMDGSFSWLDYEGHLPAPH